MDNPDCSSDGTTIFEVEIEGALEVKIELHLYRYMLMYLLVQKCAQNDSIKGKLEEALHVVLEVAPKISL